MAGRKTAKKRNVLELCQKHSALPQRTKCQWFTVMSPDCQAFLLEARRLIKAGDVAIGGTGLMRVLMAEFPEDAAKQKHLNKRLGEWIKQ